MTNEEKAYQIAWEYSKHYDPNVCKQEWVEMGAREMASWKDEQFVEEKKQWIKKAYEWLNNNAGGYLDYESVELDKESLLEDFKQAMEE